MHEKYEKICEEEGIVFDEIFYEDNQKDERIASIFKNYWDDFCKIEEKYYPKKNTYKWYQCFGAGCYLSEWQLALAKKVFPDYEWRVFIKQYYESDLANIAHIGKSLNQDYIIFDIICFEKYSADELLDHVGLNRNSLADKWAAENIQEGASEMVYMD
jgi:hypothetical protein